MLFDLRTVYIYVGIEFDFPRNQKDAKFLACVIAGSTNFLIGGNIQKVCGYHPLWGDYEKVAAFYPE